MGDVYDSLDNHLAEADDFAQAAVPMGMLLAWCVNLQLVSPTFLQAYESLILRLRFQEAQGSELLTACGGDLKRDFFNVQGQRFLDGFYPRFMTVFASTFDTDPYSVEENWANYAALAQVLTKIYMGGSSKQATSGTGVLKKLTSWLKRGP